VAGHAFIINAFIIHMPAGTAQSKERHFKPPPGGMPPRMDPTTNKQQPHENQEKEQAPGALYKVHPEARRR